MSVRPDDVATQDGDATYRRVLTDVVIDAAKHGTLRTPSPEGYIYFAESAGFIKIGHAVDVAQRLQLLRTGNPHKITRLAAVRGSLRGERRIHARFARDRHRGEWFRDSAALRAFILEQGSGDDGSH